MAGIFRAAQARRAVLMRIEAAERSFMALEEDLRARGKTYQAEGAHQHVLWLHRAFVAEKDDPEPRPGE